MFVPRISNTTIYAPQKNTQHCASWANTWAPISRAPISSILQQLLATVHSKGPEGLYSVRVR